MVTKTTIFRPGYSPTAEEIIEHRTPFILIDAIIIYLNLVDQVYLLLLTDWVSLVDFARPDTRKRDNPTPGQLLDDVIADMNESMKGDPHATSNTKIN